MSGASDRQCGQAFPLVLVTGLLVLAAGVGVFTVGRAYAAKADAQSGADVVAVGTARRLQHELTAMAAADGLVERRAWHTRLRVTATALARANGVTLDRVTIADGAWPPTIVRVRVSAPGPAGTRIAAAAQAQVLPGAGAVPDGADGAVTAGEYRGPLVFRQGKPTCPAVAAAFDRMAAAARRGGVGLVINSAFRSDREQAILFRRHPDPKWVAPPGRSRHRNATELDLAGTPGAWTWLANHAGAFGFVQRYSWEPWHYGYAAGCGATIAPVAIAVPAVAAADPLPPWVPDRFRDVVMRAARAGGVPPVVLAALLKAESNYDPRAVSSAGAQGIAQFMPATARGLGLSDPFDPDAAIMAGGQLLGANLREFGSIPLALAAYNAGGGAVRRFGGIPPYRETQSYVARIMALAGDPSVAVGADGVVLTRIDDLFV